MFSERILFIRCLIFRKCSTSISISVTLPWVPAEGWWIITSALGRAMRLPLAPEDSRKAPMLAAMPMQMVDTSHLIYCMVS